MKKNQRNSICKMFYFLIFFTFVALAKKSYAQIEVNLNLENSSDFPYVVGESTLEDPPGSIIDLLKEVGSELGVLINFTRVPWKRCLQEMGDNVVDGCFSASYKEEREKVGVYPKVNEKVDASRRLMDSSYVLYTVKENIKETLTWDGSSFNKASPLLVTLRGFSVISVLKEKGAVVNEVDSINAALQMVLSKRVDGAVLIDLPADFNIKSNSEFSNMIVKHQDPIVTKPYFLMFSKTFYQSKKALVEKIWSLIKAKRDNGRLKELSDKYFKSAKSN